MAKPLPSGQLKKRLSPLLWLLTVITFRLRLASLTFCRISERQFHLVSAHSVVCPMVTIIGWFGAQMTFPVERIEPLPLEGVPRAHREAPGLDAVRAKSRLSGSRLKADLGRI